MCMYRLKNEKDKRYITVYYRGKITLRVIVAVIRNARFLNQKGFPFKNADISPIINYNKYLDNRQMGKLKNCI